MNPESAETWRAALAHAGELLERSPEERQRGLAELTRQQPALAAQVRELLQADVDAARSGFLDTADPLDETLPNDTLRKDSRLGPYRLVSELGSGGMGRVWLARRDDGLFDGEVAIKTLHAHLAISALRERFRREALLLGRLQHPNIARLLDAGAADSTTYLVLEYVRGQPLESWCLANDPGVAKRLELFLDICAAVAHAHANLIVHRDIKPANVLVTQEDQVKLLDFGIGKLLDADAPGFATASELTRVTGRALTPEFAAPEQIRGEAVTTATDVYSLGALLYVLLTGARPFSTPDQPAVDVEHAVLHDEARPLARAARVSGASTQRQRELSGDLEHIVQRALRKSPQDRYASVLDLAEDVRRHLRYEPVRARTGSWSYRAGRYVRRHRVAVSLGAALAISAVAGVVGVLWQSRQAHEQARIAQVQAGKATAVKEFVLGIFAANNHRHPDGERARRTSAEELLDIASEKILADVAMDPEVRAELLGTQGRLHLELDRYEQARKLFEAEVRTLESAFGRDDARVAPGLLNLSGVQLSTSKHEQARELAQRAAALLDAAGDQTSAIRARAEHQLGYAAYLSASRRDDPAPRTHFSAEVAILERLPPSQDLVKALYGLGKAVAFAGQHAEALTHYYRGIEIATKSLGPRDINAAAGHQMTGALLAHMRRLPEAEEHLAKAAEIFRYVYGAESSKMTITYLELGRVQLHQAKFPEAIAQLDRAVQLRTSLLGRDMWTETARAALAQALLGKGDLEHAGRELDTGLRLLADGRDELTQVQMLRTRAALRLKQSRPRESLDDSDVALAMARKNAGEKTLPVAQAQILRGEALTALRRLDEASVPLGEAEAILAADTSAMAAPHALDLQIAKARWQLAKGDADAAITQAQRTLETLRQREDRASLRPQEESALRLQTLARAAAPKP